MRANTCQRKLLKMAAASLLPLPPWRLSRRLFCLGLVLLACAAGDVVPSQEQQLSKAERRRARHHRQAPVEPLPSLNLAAQHGSNISFVPAPVISPEIAPVGIEWHAPIGCDHTGFFFEALTYVLGKVRGGHEGLHLTPEGLESLGAFARDASGSKT